jgi:hypothetical protein
VASWSEADWGQKFEEIIAFYKKKAAKAAKKGKVRGVSARAALVAVGASLPHRAAVAARR